jgi:glycosyltransferase involved in cell wall biosynthesis
MASAAVSVIMPVHNGERFLAEALDSVLAQTFADFVVIVLDDGSTDGTAQILSRYADRRLRVIRNTVRIGAAGARNRGLDLADTRYVAFFDSDDVAHPQRLEIQTAFLRAHPDVHFVASRVSVIDERGVPTGAVWGHEWAADAIPSAMLFANGLATSTVLVERALMLNERFNQALDPVEDYDMWLRLLDRSRVACLRDLLVQYRVHPASLMHTRRQTTEDGVRRIARDRLARLGVVPTVAELDVHRDLGMARPEGTAQALAAVARWLKKLDDANAGSRVYPPSVFRRVLAHHWLVACNAAARGGAWDAWPAILGSPFTRQLAVSAPAGRELARLPWRTARGFVRRRWPRAGAAARALAP